MVPARLEGDARQRRLVFYFHFVGLSLAVPPLMPRVDFLERSQARVKDERRLE